MIKTEKLPEKLIKDFQVIEDKIARKLNSTDIQKDLLRIMKENINSKNYLIHYFLGCYFQDIKDHQNAIECFNRTIKIEPNYPDTYYQAGCVYLKNSSYEKALALFNRARGLGFSNDLILGLIGTCLFWKKDIESILALEFFEKQKELYPHNFNQYRLNYATVLNHLGQTDRAAIEIIDALKANPFSSRAHYSDLILNMAHSINFTDQDILKIAKACNDNIFGHIKQSFNLKRRLDKEYPRVGFIFPYVNYSVAHWILELFKTRDKKFFYAAYHNSDKHESITKEIEENVDLFRNIIKADAQQASQIIYDDEIDVLFDFRTHVRGDRLDIIKHKPAPVQVTWLDSFPPSGCPEMDYVIYDKYLVPEEDDINFNEKVYRLPGNYFYYKTPDYHIEIKEPPCFKNGYITFASFHRSNKLNKPLYNTWIKILKQVEGSKLLIKNNANKEENFKKMVVAYFEENGINPDRLIMENQEELKIFFEKCNEVDICLDSFPLHGGSTNLRTLWMGKPIITQLGKRRASRITYSVLKTLELDELIAESEEEYISKVIKLSNDKERIKKYTFELRDILLKSDICSAERTQKHLEEAILYMWNDFKSKF